MMHLLLEKCLLVILLDLLDLLVLLLDLLLDLFVLLVLLLVILIILDDFWRNQIVEVSPTKFLSRSPKVDL